MIFDDIRLLISPIELQIHYKLYLSSDKDIEDAVYLWVLFREMLDGDLLQVQGEPYGIEFIYSDEDVGFIAVVPELPGCSAFGETEEEALREVKVAVSLWLEAAREEGRVIPEPAGRERLPDILAGKGTTS